MKTILFTFLMGIVLSFNSLASVGNPSNSVESSRVTGAYAKDHGFLWEPHIVIVNNTKHQLVVYTGGTFMTYYAGDRKTYYYGLFTFGGQTVVIRDMAGQVFYNNYVSDETLLTITADDSGKSPVYAVALEDLKP